ncbi:unnamed protein product [Didymodactylos carnosus]|uniref:Uncharacterized protein n=1 Tax=Didymodactylos carnosus TaxID=1234261 RepID=A0A8S2IFJ5_9BILA|nr:unnamed protein product [Didymodactylos carnosus]CAF3741526.1 unnamed protein product [Didymodactylos carnosus]
MTNQLYFASTHLEVSDESTRLVQVQKLVEISSKYQQQYSFIIADDMSSTPTSETIKKFQEQFALACKINECLPTFSSSKPTRTIV